MISLPLVLEEHGRDALYTSTKYPEGVGTTGFATQHVKVACTSVPCFVDDCASWMGYRRMNATGIDVSSAGRNRTVHRPYTSACSV